MIKDILVKVVGVTFLNPDGSSRQEVIAQIKPSDFVELRRDYNNPYDSNAIAVYFENQQVGYVNKEDAKLLSVLWDAGSVLSAVASEVGSFEGRNYLHILVSEMGEE